MAGTDHIFTDNRHEEEPQKVKDPDETVGSPSDPEKEARIQAILQRMKTTSRSLFGNCPHCEKQCPLQMPSCGRGASHASGH